MHPTAVLPPETLRALSGLDFLTGIRDGHLPGPPMAETINGHIFAVAPGSVTFEAHPTGRHLNPMGTTHGGWFGALLDSAMGCAVMTHLAAGTAYTTLEYKINLVRALPPGTVVHAIATTDHAGRSTATATGQIIGRDDGRLYATGSTTCLILRT